MQRKKGFTIIEVVLVLAIAGLIFLMVFIALPALQRSQRNTRRRQDMARILSAFNDYQANNNGAMPSNAQEVSSFVKKYVMGTSESDGGSNPASDTWHFAQTKCYSDQFCDPDGTPYSMPLHGTTSPFEGEKGNPNTSSSKHNKADTFTFQSIGSVAGGGSVGTQKAHAIIYRTNAKCGNENETVYTSGKTEITIEYILEGGAIYCGDNQ
jgi:prepilin-type N-terminal cleavage/methylation domain-containing protein